MISYEGNTANDIWLEMAKDFVSNHDATVLKSRCGPMKEYLHVFFSLKNPRQRWINSRVPSINPAFALAEIVWIMNGADESSVINFWNPALPKYAGYDNKYHGAYGFRLKNHLGMDQLKNAYLTLKANPESRQVVLQIWDANIDLPLNDGNPRASDIPCNICSMLKVRAGKLEWMQTMRSNDLFLGLPFNFIQFTTIQEIMAGWLGLEVGAYNHLSDSLHVYEKHLNNLNLSLENKSDTINNDNLACSYKDSNSYLSSIYKIMKKLSTSKPALQYFEELIDISLPQAWGNILYIIAADAAMRYNYTLLAKKLINACTNELYKKMWNNWAKRKWDF